MRGAVVGTLALFLLLPASAFPCPRAPAAGAALRVPDSAPFTVRGSGFRAGERVRIVAQVNGRHVKTVLATAKGAFTASFDGVSVQVCAGYIVRATGDKGSHAYLRHLPSCAAE